MLTIQMCCTCVSARLLQAFGVYSLFCLAIRVLFWACILARRLHNLPGHHYEKVQAVPSVSKVTLLAENPQSHHLDHHLDGKECKDEVIKVLQQRKKKQQVLFCISILSHKCHHLLKLSLKTHVASVIKQKHFSAGAAPPSPRDWKYCFDFNCNSQEDLHKNTTLWNSAPLMSSQRADTSLKKFTGNISNMQKVKKHQSAPAYTQNVINNQVNRGSDTVEHQVKEIQGPD